MSSAELRVPFLQLWYRRYLEDEDSARFVKGVAGRYTIATLERLAEHGSREGRRAATLALGLVADFSSNAVLGRRLKDPDRGVRILAENGIFEIWCRDGNESQRLWLRTIVRLNASGQWQAAREQSGQLIDEAPWFAEAWYQRAIACQHLGQVHDAVRDHLQTLERNPYHVPAAVGLAHCYWQLNKGHAALESFRRALKVNPGLERVRAQMARLKRALRRE